MRPSAPITPRLHDAEAEHVRRAHAEKLTEIINLPASGMSIVANVSLADAIATKVPHKLGRRPQYVGTSVVRGATATGRIVESARDDKFVTLTATGHGATITVDLQVL